MTYDLVDAGGTDQFGWRFENGDMFWHDYVNNVDVIQYDRSEGAWIPADGGASLGTASDPWSKLTTERVEIAEADIVIDKPVTSQKLSDAESSLEGGGTIAIPSGTWENRFSITEDDITLVGFGWASILKLPDGAASEEDGAQVLTVTGDNVTIKNLQIDGNKANQPTPTTLTQSDLITFYADGGTVESCYGHSAVDHGFINSHQDPSNVPAANADGEGGAPSDTTYKYNTVEDTGNDLQERAALQSFGAGGDLAKNTRYLYNTVRRVNDAGGNMRGIRVNRGEDDFIKGNVVEEVDADAAVIVTSDSKGTEILSNRLEPSGEPGVDNNANGTKIKDNYVKNDSICVDNSGDDVLISRNEFDTGNSAIDNSGEDVTISGNEIDASSTAITLYGPISNITVRNNNIIADGNCIFWREGVEQLVIRGNDLHNTDLRPILGFDGVNDDVIVIESNLITGAGTSFPAIQIDRPDTGDYERVRIVGNEIVGYPDDGIEIDDADDVKIYDNNVDVTGSSYVIGENITDLTTDRNDPAVPS